MSGRCRQNRRTTHLDDFEMHGFPLRVSPAKKAGPRSFDVSLSFQMHRHNDKMEDLQSKCAVEPPNGGIAMQGHGQNAEFANQMTVLKKEFAWCVVQTDRVNFQLKNVLWGVALGKPGGAAGTQDEQVAQSVGASGEPAQTAERAADVAALTHQVQQIESGKMLWLFSQHVCDARYLDT